MEDGLLGEHLLGVEDGAAAPGARVLVAGAGDGGRVARQAGLLRAVLAVTGRKAGRDTGA